MPSPPGTSTRRCPSTGGISRAHFPKSPCIVITCRQGRASFSPWCCSQPRLEQIRRSDGSAETTCAPAARPVRVAGTPRGRTRRGGPARRAGEDGSRPPRDATRRRGREAQHRHGGRRASGWQPGARVAADLNSQLVLLTKRAALMESQVDVLEGKRRALNRYRDALTMYVEALTAFGDVPLAQRSAKTTPKLVADTSGVPARRLAVAPRRAGGPPSRDRPGDARRTGPEPDQHRAPGPDRRTARGDRSGRCRRRGPPARGDGPADARGDQVVHLRRSPDGPRRPRAGPDPPPRRQGARAASGHPRRIRLAGSRPAPADGPRERAVPHHRRGGGRLSQRPGRPGLGPARLVRGGRGPCLGIAGDRRDAARTRRPTRPRRPRTCRRPLPR